MIRQFGPETGLLLIDVQKGVNVFEHWGGGHTGRRNNPDAETRMAALLARWREADLPVFFTRHDSREAASPLKFSLPTGAQIDGFEPSAGNLGYDTDLAHDACATCNRIGPAGTDYDPQLLHDISVANMHGEFCTALETAMLVGLTRADAPDLHRVQGNE